MAYLGSRQTGSGAGGGRRGVVQKVLVCRLPGATATHLQQGPFVTLGAPEAPLLLPVHGAVNSGEVRA